MTTDISKLNQYCLYSIFEQIKNNCEQDERRLPDIIRYRDLICFAVTNDYLNSQFRCWNKSLYMRLEVEKIHSWTCQIIYINFYELHVSQKKCTSAERKVFWDIFLISIEGNTRLTHCLLSFFPKTDYCPDHVEMFEKTMRVLAKKKLLKSLTLRMLGKYILYILTALNINKWYFYQVTRQEIWKTFKTCEVSACMCQWKPMI